MEAVKREDSQQAAADGGETSERANPEIFSKRPLRRKAVLTELPALDAGHDQRRDGGAHEKRAFRKAQSEWSKAGNGDNRLVIFAEHAEYCEWDCQQQKG